MSQKTPFCYAFCVACQLDKHAKRSFMSVNDINSLSHTKWNCKYHLVFALKFSVSSFMGYLKGKSSTILYDKLGQQLTLDNYRIFSQKKVSYAADRLLTRSTRQPGTKGLCPHKKNNRLDRWMFITYCPPYIDNIYHVVYTLCISRRRDAPNGEIPKANLLF